MSDRVRKFMTGLPAALAFALYAAAPLTAAAADGPFQVAENPAGAVYMLNEPAVPLRVTFAYDPQAGLGCLSGRFRNNLSRLWFYSVR